MKEELIKFVMEKADSYKEVDKMSNYEKCLCENNPSINQNEFTFEVFEYGCLDNTLILEKIATCKKCGEVFKFSIKK